MYYLLMQCLSMVDILVGIFGCLVEGLWTITVTWNAGTYACKLLKFLQLTILHMSAYTVVCIGWDRYIAVLYPMKSKSEESSFTVNRKMLLIVGLSMLSSIPQVSSLLYSKKRKHFIGSTNNFCGSA